VGWAERALADRGAAFIISARFVPVGRVAVNMTAGTVGFPRARFSMFAGGAAVAWSAYSILLGAGASRMLDHPLLGAAVGITCGLCSGVLVDRVVRRLRDRRPLRS
jgi:membrane-associated protein